jgi:adenylate cyclase class 2
MGQNVRERGRGAMPEETEIKLRIGDIEAFQKALQRMGAREVGLGRVHELNVVFDTAEGGLRRKGQLLRIRTATRVAKGEAGGGKQRFLLTFKRPTPQQLADAESGQGHAWHKVREEIEVEVTEATILSKIFEGLGMWGRFRYEKYRTTYEIGGSKQWGKGLLIEVDETPIGVFAELEGPPEAIDRAAQELGFSKEDYVVSNYFELYMEDCRAKGQKPGDMVYQEGKADAR